MSGKKAIANGWPELVDVSDLDITGWCKQYSYAKNTGFLTRHTPALDIDVLSAEAVAAAMMLVRNASRVVVGACCARGCLRKS